jgi:hypothetical protein
MHFVACNKGKRCSPRDDGLCNYNKLQIGDTDVENRELHMRWEVILGDLRLAYGCGYNLSDKKLAPSGGDLYYPVAETNPAQPMKTGNYYRRVTNCAARIK